MPDHAKTPYALLESLRRLTDDELVARVKGLAGRERRATALLVAHFAELDTRDVHLRAGYSSLFNYCREVLALSEDEAYNRIEASRAARRFPVVLDLLGAGDVSLTAVRLLGRHLRLENHLSVLESARRKKKADIEQILVRLAPRPDVPASVRKLPEPRQAAAEFCATGQTAPTGPTVPGEKTTGGTERSVGCRCPALELKPISRPLRLRPFPLKGRPRSARPRSSRSPRNDTSTSSRSAPRPSRSFGSPRTCCATRCPRATTRRSSTAP